MIPTAAEPIVLHSGPVDGVCPQDYPITYGHLINSFCFGLEASTLFIYYNQETKKFCKFFFEKLPIIEQNKQRAPSPIRKYDYVTIYADR